MNRIELVEKVLTGSVIGAFYDVYNHLGFGFLEHVYISALEREMIDRGHRVGREVSVPIMYKRQVLTNLRLDLIVDERLVLEVKSTYILHPAAHRQIYNYLRATKLEVGLLLHFGPEPKVHRLFCRNDKRANPLHPLDPDASGQTFA